MLKKTMTTKECLHRFCSDCIITALRSGNKECPTCRKKLVSKRSLRPDPNFDYLISVSLCRSGQFNEYPSKRILLQKIYPSRDEYEAHQEKVLAKFNKSHSQQALVNSITEGIKLQSQNRPSRVRKGQEDVRENQNGETTRDPSANSQGESTRQSSNPPSARSTPSPVPSHSSSTSKAATKRARSIMTTSEKSELTDSESASEVEGQTEDSNAETEDGTDGGDEIELVFKPHPNEMGSDNVVIKALKENVVRYLKTTSNASVDHLSKYLAMRLSLDAQMADTTLPTLVYTIYIAPMPNQYVVLNGNQTLQQVNERFWKVSD